MANSYFNWPASLNRFVPLDTARADDVNDAFDALSAGLDEVSADIASAIKISSTSVSQEIPDGAGARAGKVITFDEDGNVMLSENTYDSTLADAAEAQASAEAAAASAATAQIAADGLVQTADGVKDLFIAGTHYTSGVTTQLTLSQVPVKANAVKVFFDGVYQNKDTWSRVGNVITFNTALVVDDVEVQYEIPSLFIQPETLYLGAQASGPALDGEGNPLIAGVKYFNTTDNKMYVRNTSGTWQLDTADSGYVNFVPAGTGAVATTVQSKLRESVSVLDFGADPTGATSSYSAFVAALAAANNITIPPGVYLIDQQINITGNKIIAGPANNSLYVSQQAVINFTAASGNCFFAGSAEYDGIYIGNLRITGGNGGYAIRSSRPQSRFENINMEVFNGGGVQLFEAGTGSQASWGTAIVNVKWVGPNSPTPYIAFDVTANGGHILIEDCSAVKGSIGLNINQGQAIRVSRCSFNLQTSQGGYNYSSLPVTSQCAIRLSGAGYKEGVEIDSCYLEACTYAIYVEKVEGLFIHGNYIADVGVSSNYASIFLKASTGSDTNVNNVLIQGNCITDQGNAMSSIEVQDKCNNVAIYNNYMKTIAAGSVNIKNTNTFRTYHQNNTFIYNIGNGLPFSDAPNTLVNTNFQSGGFFTYSRFEVLCAPGTWYDLGPVTRRSQIWQVNVIDANSPSTCTQVMVYIDASLAAVLKVMFSDNSTGSNGREVRVSNGIIQFRTTITASNQLTTASAILMS